MHSDQIRKYLSTCQLGVELGQVGFVEGNLEMLG